MPTRNISLTDHLDRFVDENVASGQYGNASEVVREALRLLQERQRLYEEKLAWLREASDKAFDQIERGEKVEINSSKELRNYFEAKRKRVSAKLAAARRSA